MPLPILPLEVWLEILDVACLMDMNVPTVLSQTTKKLREVSRFHRYHSVKLQGHEQLLAFEKQYSGVPEESRSIINLLVTLPCLASIAYDGDGPDGGLPGMDIADDGKDSSYESSMADGEEDSKMDVDFEDSSSAPSELGDSVDDLDYGDMSTEEFWDLKREIEDIPSLLKQVPIPESLKSPALSLNAVIIWGDTLQSNDIGGRDLSQISHLSTYHHRGPQTEYKVFSALRRILELASSSLKQFALFWEPQCDFNVDALFPVLPMLQSLAVFEPNISSTYTAVKMMHQKFAAFPRLFPALRRIDVSEVVAQHWASTLLMALTDAPSLQFATLPCILVEAMLEYGLLLRLLPRSRSDLPSSHASTSASLVPLLSTTHRTTIIDSRPTPSRCTQASSNREALYNGVTVGARPQAPKCSPLSSDDLANGTLVRATLEPYSCKIHETQSMRPHGRRGDKHDRRRGGHQQQTNLRPSPSSITHSFDRCAAPPLRRVYQATQLFQDPTTRLLLSYGSQARASHRLLPQTSGRPGHTAPPTRPAP
ncbi:hypothetical protein NMY22_g11938 [Coprinellus aureogranulatus]|nr:hypothetical protein NMY22_g11938 [Coprinellus aureogranulatus]